MDQRDVSESERPRRAETGRGRIRQVRFSVGLFLTLLIQGGNDMYDVVIIEQVCPDRRSHGNCHDIR